MALRQTLYRQGVPRWFVAAQIRAGRWARAGRQVVVLHNGPLTAAQRRRAAVLAAGPRAALAGTSALQEVGLQVQDDGRVHVIVPRGGRPRPVAGACVHESRRFREDDVLSGPPRTVRPVAAAVQAALWARTDREAVLLLTMPVQQRLVRPSELVAALQLIQRHRRRRLLLQVAADVSGGAQSLGELDVSAALRRRGLPEPVRQALRRRSTGVQYLDLDFPEHELTIEVDGSGHDLPDQRLQDLLRDVDLGIEGRTVIRIPLVAWRIGEAQVLDALERLFRARGWRAAA